METTTRGLLVRAVLCGFVLLTTLNNDGCPSDPCEVTPSTTEVNNVVTTVVPWGSGKKTTKTLEIVSAPPPSGGVTRTTSTYRVDEDRESCSVTEQGTAAWVREGASHDSRTETQTDYFLADVGNGFIRTGTITDRVEDESEMDSMFEWVMSTTEFTDIEDYVEENAWEDVPLGPLNRIKKDIDTVRTYTTTLDQPPIRRKFGTRRIERSAMVVWAGTTSYPYVTSTVDTIFAGTQSGFRRLSFTDQEDAGSDPADSGTDWITCFNGDENFAGTRDQWGLSGQDDCPLEANHDY